MHCNTPLILPSHSSFRCLACCATILTNYSHFASQVTNASIFHILAEQGEKFTSQPDFNDIDQRDIFLEAPKAEIKPLFAA